MRLVFLLPGELAVNVLGPFCLGLICCYPTQLCSQHTLGRVGFSHGVLLLNSLDTDVVCFSGVPLYTLSNFLLCWSLEMLLLLSFRGIIVLLIEHFIGSNKYISVDLLVFSSLCILHA